MEYYFSASGFRISFGRTFCVFIFASWAREKHKNWGQRICSNFQRISEMVENEENREIVSKNFGNLTEMLSKNFGNFSEELINS
jgi:hypothetical protein